MCEGEKTREERDERSCVARPCRWTSVEADRQCWAWGGLGSLGIFVGTTVYTVSCVARRYANRIESKMVKAGDARGWRGYGKKLAAARVIKYLR